MLTAGVSLPYGRTPLPGKCYAMRVRARHQSRAYGEGFTMSVIRVRNKRLRASGKGYPTKRVIVEIPPADDYMKYHMIRRGKEWDELYADSTHRDNGAK